MPERRVNHSPEVVRPINNVGAPDVAPQRQDLLSRVSKWTIAGMKFFGTITSRRATVFEPNECHRAVGTNHISSRIL